MPPAQGVRIVKFAIEDIARDFIIEAHVVAADDAGFRHREQIVNAAGKRGFVVAFGIGLLRRYPVTITACGCDADSRPSLQ